MHTTVTGLRTTLGGGGGTQRQPIRYQYTDRHKILRLCLFILVIESHWDDRNYYDKQ